MFSKQYLYFVWILYVINSYFPVIAQENAEISKCRSYTKCSSCIQQLGCFWCTNPKKVDLPSDKNISSSLNNCIPEAYKEVTCSQGDIVDPQRKFKSLQNFNLQSKKGEIIQLKPQRVHIALRVGDSYDLEFQYSQAKNYPVDLYFIVDNSFSMAAFKDKLEQLGVEFSEAMNNITNNFRIGLGSFVDKRELPFVNTIPSVLRNPCPREGEYDNCVTPYSFKNHLSLSKNFNEFHREVKRTALSGNSDAPEGSLDALMQAIVCKKEIGWRQDARHFIVIATDGPFHMAGDGKLVGVFETNDAKCHMVNNIYDGLATDYPSVSQLNYVAKEHNINILFALVKNDWNSYVIETHKMLSEHIENLKVEILSEDFTNVIDITRNNYMEIVDSVTFESNASEHFEVKITPHCKKPKPSGCAELHLGEVVNVTVTIRSLSCDPSKMNTAIISVKPIGVNESLIIELETHCSCNCESPRNSTYIANADKCSKGAGDLVCGVCACHENYRGSLCECEHGASEISNLTELCRPKSGERMCSGLGDCECGECTCHRNRKTNKKYWGKFCECDDDSCDRENGLLCGGNGDCSCGICRCYSGWTGSSCACLDKNTTCIRGGESVVCSSRGSCQCGQCECFDNYSGKYCEDCPTCEGKCNELRDCVECKIFHLGPLRHDCDSKCLDYGIHGTKEVVVVDRMKGEKICRVLDENNCTMIYKYKYDESKKLVVTVRNTKICEPNLIVWILMVVGFILLVGLLTLVIWKITTTIHDKREYVKFMHELKNSKLNANDNPLYRGATTTFQNPSFQTGIK